MHEFKTKTAGEILLMVIILGIFPQFFWTIREPGFPLINTILGIALFTTVLGLIFGIALWMTLKTKYYVSDDGILEIDQGIFSEKFKVERIQKIKKFRFFMDYPFDTKERMLVIFENRSLLLTPRDSVDLGIFLKSLNPKIEMDL